MEKINKLKKKFKELNLDGYLIPKGLIPLPEGERSTFEKNGQTLAKFDSSVLKKK